MIIVFKPTATVEDKTRLKAQLEARGYQIHASDGVNASLFGVVGDTSALDMNLLLVNEGVEKVMRVQEPFKRANRAFHPDDSIVNVAGVPIGGKKIQVIAGPCSVESIDQITAVAQDVKASGATLLRGGAFKPRTSPYSFQGLKELGLDYLKAAREATGLPIVTEIMSAEYIMAGGNDNVILCERGIRTFEHYTRNTLDLSAIPAVKKLSHLPVVVDPSHAAGLWWMVEPLAKAAVAVGADGLLIEVHNNPECALCDGAQSLKPARFAKLMGELKGIAQIVGREL